MATKAFSAARKSRRGRLEEDQSFQVAILAKPEAIPPVAPNASVASELAANTIASYSTLETPKKVPAQLASSGRLSCPRQSQSQCLASGLSVAAAAIVAHMIPDGMAWQHV